MKRDPGSPPRSLFWVLAGCLPTLLFAACMGGTGTDTENGLKAPVVVSARVLDAGGRPLPGVEIRVRPLFSDADSPRKGPAGSASETLRTDSSGRALFSLGKPGTYRATGLSGTKVIFSGTLRAVTGIVDTAVFRTAVRTHPRGRTARRKRGLIRP